MAPGAIGVDLFRGLLNGPGVLAGRGLCELHAGTSHFLGHPDPIDLGFLVCAFGSNVSRCLANFAKGRDVVAPSLAAGLAGEIRKLAEPEGPVLSPREREVLKLIAAGGSIPAMAKQLYLAPSTVKTHVQRLYEKLGVNDRAAAVAEAMRRKLLD